MAKVKISFRKNRAAKNGEVQVEIAVAHKGETAYINTGVSVAPEYWKGEEENWIKGLKNSRTLNSMLSNALIQAKSRLIKLQNSTGTRNIDCKTLRDMLSPSFDKDEYEKEQQKKETLKYRWELYTSKLSEESGTRKIYDDTWASVMAYDDKADEMMISGITDVWLYSFDRWMRKKGISGKGCGTNTISIKMRCIKAVVYDAIDDDVIAKNPFRKYKVSNEPTKEQPMTEEELKLVWMFRTEDKAWMEWIDLFKLCFYLIGINMADLSSIKEVDKDGYIRYKRRKTGKDYCIKVEPEAMSIIERYKGNDHLLAVFDRNKSYETVTKNMIRAVKKIDAPVMENKSASRDKGRNHGPRKIDYGRGRLKDVQQYSTRRTWATLAYNECGIPMDTISLCLGHSDGMGLSVTQRYVRPNQQKIDDANRKVIDYLNGLVK